MVLDYVKAIKEHDNSQEKNDTENTVAPIGVTHSGSPDTFLINYHRFKSECVKLGITNIDEIIKLWVIYIKH